MLIQARKDPDSTYSYNLERLHLPRRQSKLRDNNAGNLQPGGTRAVPEVSTVAMAARPQQSHLLSVMVSDSSFISS